MEGPASLGPAMAYFEKNDDISLRLPRKLVEGLELQFQSRAEKARFLNKMFGVKAILHTPRRYWHHYQSR
jgi:hypothetical protein